jgi:PST family polysaccharide transporter
MFRFTAVISIVTVIGFAIGIPWGIEGVAVAYLAVTLLLQPVYVRLTTRFVGVTPLDWLRSISIVSLSGLAMLVVVLGFRELLVDAGVAVGLRLALSVVVGGIVYTALVWSRDREVRAEIGRLRERRRGGARIDIEPEQGQPNPAALPPLRDL